MNPQVTERNHYVIIIPGLGDNVKLTTLGTNHWRNHGFIPLVHSVGWHDDVNEFVPKLNKIVDLIDSLPNKVSLVGCSAGGSAVINAYSSRKGKIHKVVNVCGRIRIGKIDGFRGFTKKTASSQAFAQSVKLSDNNLKTFNKQDLSKIMTVSAMFGDQLVPKDTSYLEGAYNYDIPTGEHVLSISMALTLYSKNILNFLK